MVENAHLAGETISIMLDRPSDDPFVKELQKRGTYYPSLNTGEMPATRNNARLCQKYGIKLDDSLIPYVSTEKLRGWKKGLYPFQIDAIAKMSDVKQVLLFAEMGTGKTPMTARYVVKCGVENTLPILVICPASLKYNWKKELEAWGNIDSVVLSGLQETTFNWSGKATIINYDILGRDYMGDVVGWYKKLLKIPYKLIVADECQYISGYSAIRSKAFRKLCVNHNAKKIMLSGTPFESRTEQFFNVLHSTLPEVFPDRYKFLWRYCDPKMTPWGWQYKGLTHAEELSEKIAPYMIRIKKEDVLTDLPPKQRIMIYADVTDKERRIYDEENNKLAGMLLDVKITNAKAIELISSLRQFAYLAKQNAAIRYVDNFLDSYPDKKLVVFVYHKIAFEGLSKKFVKIAVGINGATSPQDRQKAVEEFQSGKARLFIGQIRAAGAGITLTAADTAVFLEFGTTFAQHEQAEDRIHRISQNSGSVTEVYFMLDNSVDVDTMKILNERSKSLACVLDGAGEKDGGMFDDTDILNGVLANYRSRSNG